VNDTQRHEEADVKARLKFDISALDRLLDQTRAGLLLPLRPDEGDRGGCNIVIRGRPGTGKSTLALQMAVAACKAIIDPEAKAPKQGFFSVYASLEHSPDAIIKHSKAFGWEKQLCPLEYLFEIEEQPSQTKLGEALARILKWPDECNSKRRPCAEAQTLSTEPRVLLPRFCPRSLQIDPEDADRLFWRRYKELENLLTAAAWLGEERHELPELKLVAIDSLNVFGDKPLEREQLFRLFDLFARYGIISVFVVEEHETEEHTGILSMRYSTVEYLADIVIAMEHVESEGYLFPTIQIVKSRYQKHVPGKHPFKILEIPSKEDSKKPEPNCSPKDNKEPEPNRPAGIAIYPSMHTIIREAREAALSGPNTDKTDTKKFPEVNDSERGSEAEKDYFNASNIAKRIEKAGKEGYNLGTGKSNTGYSGFHSLDRIGSISSQKPRCIAVVGSRATFKSVIGFNFAMRAAVCGHHSVIMTFPERHLTDARGRFSEDIFYHNVDPEKELDDIRKARKAWNGKTPKLKDLKEFGLKMPDRGFPLLDPRKVEKKYYILEGHNDKEVLGSLSVINFSPGMLLPEEFIEELLHEIGRTKEETLRRGIKRVVLGDVARIGVSYPLLRSVPTSSNLFLTALVDLLKSRDIDVMLIAGITDELEGKKIADKIITLADVIVKCDFYDVFGQRYVGIAGEVPGRVAEPKEPIVPGVVVQRDDTNPEISVYRIDDELLGGLVGFESKNIYRPGASVYVFEERTQAHHEYNKSLGILLRRAFCQSRRSFAAPQVAVEPFYALESDPVHVSLDVLQDKPIDRTLVMTIDEFWTEKGLPTHSLEALSEFAHGLKYISGCTSSQSQEARDEGQPDKAKPAEDDSSLIPLPEGRIELIPYYGNVLLLAYRASDYTEKMEWKSWSEILSHAREIAKHDLKSSDKPLLFDFPLTSDETLACVFLDLLLGCSKKNELVNRLVTTKIDDWVAEIAAKESDRKSRAFCQRQKKADTIRGQKILEVLLKSDFDSNSGEIDALQALFEDRLVLEGDNRYKQYGDDSTDEDKRLSPMLKPDAAVYCCWYTQLRALIAEYPELSDKLKVVPLPRLGFRGDWFWGVINGSVSLKLGEQLISIICEASEEYKRFVKGIGLPTRRRFLEKEKLSAWPGISHEHCSLNQILSIHKNALSRSAIPCYRSFRYILISLFKQAIGWRSPKLGARTAIDMVSEQIRSQLSPKDIEEFERNLNANKLISRKFLGDL
jgi:KaiC/GvpD/RAD55 family RecA-like ATPase